MADNFLYVAADEKVLASSISSTDTTITLNNLNSRDGTALTMADFGTTGFATLEPNGAAMELISFTGITGNQLTGVTRGLRFEAPYTQDVPLQLAHSAGATLVFSNSPQFYNQLTSGENEETINQVWTFINTSIPRQDTYLGPTLDQEFAPKKYVDDTATAGAPDANETTKGIVQLSTSAELAVGTSLGSTGARLVAPNDLFNATASATTLVPVTDGAGKLDQGFLDLSDSFTFTGAVTASSTLDIDVATNWQLGGVAYTGTMADLNEASAFFQTTSITGAQAESLIDGSVLDASVHSHDGTLGAKSSTGEFTYAGYPQPDVWMSAQGAITPNTGALGSFISSGAGWSFVFDLTPVNGDPDSAVYEWADLPATAEWRMCFTNGTTGDRSFGFSNAGLGIAYNNTTIRRVAFGANGGTLYAVTCNGATTTTTDISAGLTLTDWHTYRIEAGATSAEFFVDGVSLATINTTYPSGAAGVAVEVGGGGTANGEDLLFSPVVITQSI